LADTLEQQLARGDYNSWTRLIKTPPKRELRSCGMARLEY
jgi:hypothetical protein